MGIKFRLAVIYVEYDHEKYASALGRLKEYLGKADWFEKTYIIVNNRENGDHFAKRDSNTFVLQGDNSDREFSGWQKGIDFLYSQNLDFDLVLFANEVFDVLKPSYLSKYAGNWLLLKSLLFKIVVGEIDRKSYKSAILGHPVRSWACTNCFFIPKVILDRIGNIITVDNKLIDRFFEKEYSPDKPVFRPDAPIDEKGKEIITVWLTEFWRRKITLDENSWGLFRDKARAIFNEQLLSSRIRREGFMILPYNIPGYYIFGSGRALKRILKSRLQHHG